ncbi:acetyltransferase (GNAT) family protein [Rhizobium sp. ERR 922]|uniref:GNAT family N-acetyltransferase n=1 Tax=unclassified Rhizobium TaxID=2613769 RepID=UPI0011A815C6|nr:MULTISPECIES: GNAT family N-acetyltransferase [unclassified Rhizobium]TWB48025.1 acetyltransferase (GNAT) family protein [Rhizobium sp. ERR 922]TWB89634.1 acetyltransferase (GNAT) family protein [Rhizobium sp. ERR 942]
MPDIRLISAAEARTVLRDLCDVLADCVNGGASVGFMQPYMPADALPYWQSVADSIESGGTLLFVAVIEGRVVGTVQVGVAQMPNQPHRGDLKKLLVHRSARGKGLARLLMEAAEREAARIGKTLLVLDTATGSDAEAIYPRLGWQRVGVVPDYAMWPEGGLCDTTIFYKRIAA